MNPLSNALLSGLGGGAGGRASGLPQASSSGLGAASQFAAMLRSGSPPAPSPMAAPAPAPMPSATKPAQPPRAAASSTPKQPDAATAQPRDADAPKATEASEQPARKLQAGARASQAAEQAEPAQTDISKSDLSATADSRVPDEVEADADTELAADEQDGAKDIGNDADPANPLVSIQQLPAPDALPDALAAGLAAGLAGQHMPPPQEAATERGTADRAEIRARIDATGTTVTAGVTGTTDSTGSTGAAGAAGAAGAKGAAGTADASLAADAHAGPLAEKAELLRSAATASPDGETGDSHATVTSVSSQGAFDTMLGAAAGTHARSVHAGLTGANAAMPARVDLPQPLYSSGFAPEMAARLSVIAADGVQHARLHLNPAEMGPVAVQILVDGQQAQISFHSDQADTRAVLERSLPELAAALRDNGLTLSGGGVFQQARDPGQGGQGQAQAGQGLQRSLGGQPGGEALLPEAAAAPAPRSRGVVDLYA